MDFSFLAIAFNIKKMCAKMIKEGMNWLMKLFYKLTTAIFRCWEQTNQRSIQNIAAQKNEPIVIVNEKKKVHRALRHASIGFHVS